VRHLAPNKDQTMRLVLAAALLFATSLSAVAQSEEEVNQRIDTVLGDHQIYREAFDAIQEAVEKDDAEPLSAYVFYPITVRFENEGLELESAEDLIANYETVMTDEIRSAILDQEWADLFVNSEGLMFGDGQVWLNGICEDDTCEIVDVQIVAIQSAVE
jgi:hypothetical protein